MELTTRENSKLGSKTISTVPTYALVSKSFANWRGMEESGGRRIKRSFFIDVKSIKFCTLEMIEKYRNIRLLKSYIEEKEKNWPNTTKHKKLTKTTWLIPDT
ncbi:MAG: mechanosensitive ion channel [Chloroflexia bacterium]|nr:mechanosensitive ion channel [Chloroflexia bacterium]